MTREANMLIAALLVVLFSASPAQGLYDGDPGSANPDRHVGVSQGWRSSIYMVGDSLTWRAYSNLRHLGVRWEIDARPGREVNTLPLHLSDRLSNPHRLSVVVIALGTNADSGWTKADVVRQVKRLPKSTRVILMSDYRDRSNPQNVDSILRHSPRLMYRYSRWYNQIARSRPHTCVAPWRSYARSHRYVLADGVHPKPAYRTRWARIVLHAVRTCR